MGYDVLVVALIALSVAAAVLFIIARDRSRRHGEGDVARAWQAYGRSRGLEFEAPSGEWPNRTVPRLSSGDVSLVLVREGADDRVLTRLELRPREAVLGRLVVTTEGECGGLPPASHPDDALDLAFTVHAKPSSLAESVLTNDVCRALSAFRMGGALRVEYERGRIVLEWSGGEQNPARLDEARSVAEALERALAAVFARSN